MRGQRRLPGWSSVSSLTRGLMRLDGISTISFSAYLPSLWRCVERIPRRGSDSGPSTAAPAPSPKMTATSRPSVVRSMPVEWSSEPTPTTARAAPAGKVDVGGEVPEQDEGQVGGADAGHRERVAGGACAQIRRARVRVDEAPLADAGALLRSE